MGMGGGGGGAYSSGGYGAASGGSYSNPPPAPAYLGGEFDFDVYPAGPAPDPGTPSTEYMERAKSFAERIQVWSINLKHVLN
jgi:hypothetical protein